MIKKILISFLLLLNFSVLSCGTDFQKMLFANRHDVLTQAPIGMFADKMQSLSKDFSVADFPLDKDDGAPLDNYGYDGDSSYERERKNIEAKFLTKKQFTLVNQARAAGNLSKAIEILKDQKGAFVDYTLAKYYYDLFHNTSLDDLSENEELLIFSHSYEEVAKPQLGIDNDPWRLWGLYMLGKTQADNSQYQQSIETFNQVQAIVAQGLSDPLHLAADSLGAQALSYDAIGQYDKAVKNYLKLHHLGHTYANQWLKKYADSFIQEKYWLDDNGDFQTKPNPKIQAAIKQPLIKRLLVIYAYTHLSSGLDIFNENFKDVPEMDQMAAYAYRTGAYEYAEKYAIQSQSNLAKLIQAKLQLRQGNNKQAAKIYAQIVSSIKDNNQAYDKLSSEACSAIAESSIFAINEGNIEQAFDLLLTYTQGEYWQDISYIAEHLLPLDTLIRKVDALPNNLNLNKVRSNKYWQFNIFHDINSEGKMVSGIQHDYVTGLSYLTARRLIRAKQYTKAKNYIPVKYNQTLDKLIMQNKAITQTHGKQKAENLFQLAKLIRKNWKLYAYEGYPDWLMFKLNYANSSPLPPQTIDKDANNLWYNPKEVEILAKNNSYALNRYSYRYLATETARQAADMIDTQDSNYAKYLCYATKWVLVKDAKLGREIFHQYLKNAKPKKSVKYFGQRCDG